MKVGINIVPLFPGKIGGAEQYIRNVINLLEKDEELELFLFLNDFAIETFNETNRLHKILIDLDKPHAPQMTQYIDYYALDIWFCPLFHLIPQNCEIPSAVMIFDIQQEFYPEYFSKQELNERKIQTANTLKNATTIITISEFSKNTIIEKYGIEEQKIFVTYLDADGCFSAPFDTELNCKVQKRLPDKYLFYPANTWPHKNHIALLKAFYILKSKYDIDFKLVFTGNQDKERKNIERFINEKNLRDDVQYLGYIPQKEMPYVFHNAKLLVFPSKFEGFGIPLVEAMKSELPIVCSSSTCIPEIVGDAALLFDENDPEDIAEKIYELYENKDLSNTLIENGKKRCDLFSWENCSQKTIEILKQLYVPIVRKSMFSSTKYPLVSIITPSYNQSEFIKETIESVLTQDYPNIEYIIIDGGSTDNTIDILKSYGSKITWVSEKDEGQADAVNKGILRAHGEIIGWLNSDDTYCKGAISKIVDFFYNHPKVDMVYGEGYYIDRESNITERYPTAIFDYNELAYTCYICQPTAFFTRKIVLEVGMLDKDLHLCMDYELWMKIGKKSKIVYMPEYLATSRMYEENKTLSRRKEVYNEVCQTVNKYYGFVPASWCNGYAYYLTNGSHGFKFKFIFGLFFLKYNLKNYSYIMFCLKKFIKKKYQNKKNKCQESFSGKYSDGWISSSYKVDLLVCKKVEMLVIEGQHLLPFKKKIEIKLFIDNIFKGSLILDELGDFQYCFELDQNLSEGYHSIMLKTNSTYNPKKNNTGADNRDLSVRILKVDFK